MNINKEYNIGVIRGDGIGPEVVDSAIKVLEKVSSKYGFQLEFDYYLAGGAALDRFGIPLPKETLHGVLEKDAVLLGALGGPKWDTVDPSIRPEKALLGLRKELGLYANLRPAILFDELASASPLRAPGDIDLMIVRELTGGIYFGDHGSNGSGITKSSYDVEVYSYSEIERILRVAFGLAMGRRKHITLVDKANVLESSRLWREVASVVSIDFPEVSLEYLYVDNCAMQLVSRPSSFDVVVTSNLFGDIISDEAGAITGSIGLLPSASLGDKGTPGMYEPVHGSAPDITGLNKANPIATILSAAMMLRLSLNESIAADNIEKAVRKTITMGYRTHDIDDGSGNYIISSTDEMTKAIISNI